MRQDERVGIAEVTLQGRDTFGNFDLRDQALLYDSVTEIVDKLQKDRPAAVIRLVNVNDWIYPNIHKAGNERAMRRPIYRSIPFLSE